MSRPLVAVLVLAALGVGYLLGTVTSTSGSDQDDAAEITTLRAEVERSRRALGERGPRLDPAASLVGRGGTPRPRGDPSGGFDVTRFDDAQDAFRALLGYCARMLAKGADGHLPLLEQLNRNLFRDPGKSIARQMLGSEEQAARFHYPLLRFALSHDVELTALTETVYRTMAEEPQRLAEIDDQLLEIFAETLGYLLPGMVGTKRLERLEGYARSVLATPPGEQPQSVRRLRRDVQRVLDSWAPPLTPQEALARLHEGAATAEEIASLLQRVTPEMTRSLDLDALIGPLLERDGFRVLGLLVRLRPEPAVLAKLDQRVVDGVLKTGGTQGFIPYYLRFTGRDTWAKGRDFIEGALQQADAEAAGVFAVAALGVGEGPPEDWLRWALERYSFPPEVRQGLSKRLR